jgi:hypothetical protein
LNSSDTSSTAAGEATAYYTTKKGANFGGYCANAACVTQALASKQVSFCAGMVGRTIVLNITSSPKPGKFFEV